MQCHALRDEDKIDRLYGEADAETARKVAEHLTTCAACREEMTGLREARKHLAAWGLPAEPRPRRALPAWALPAAAAVLLALAGVVVLRGAEVSFDEGRFSARLGSSDREVRRLLAEQEARHTREMETLRASLARPATVSPASAVSLGDVERIVRDAEARADERYAARFQQVTDRAEAQRRLDLARVSASLSYLEGRTGQHLARTNELMNEMLQASYQR